MLLPDKAMQTIVNTIRIVFELWIFILLWAGSVIFSFSKRKSEFIADKFACDTGYGEQLVEALYMTHKMSLGQNTNLLTRMRASHPRISKRIGILEAFIDGDMEI